MPQHLGVTEITPKLLQQPARTLIQAGMYTLHSDPDLVFQRLCYCQRLGNLRKLGGKLLLPWVSICCRTP